MAWRLIGLGMIEPCVRSPTWSELVNGACEGRFSRGSGADIEVHHVWCLVQYRLVILWMTE